MADFQILPFSFNDTNVVFVANTPAAKARIWGGVSVNIRKSAAPDFTEALEADGFIVETQ
jgi:hypothetical protein